MKEISRLIFIFMILDLSGCASNKKNIWPSIYGGKIDAQKIELINDQAGERIGDIPLLEVFAGSNFDVMPYSKAIRDPQKGYVQSGDWLVINGSSDAYPDALFPKGSTFPTIVFMKCSGYPNELLVSCPANSHAQIFRLIRRDGRWRCVEMSTMENEKIVSAFSQSLKMPRNALR